MLALVLLSIRTLAVSPAPSAVQESIRLQVQDVRSSPVAYAIVDVNGAVGRLADSLGRLTIPGARADSLFVRVRRVGFVPFAETVGRDADGVFRVVLSRVATEIDAVRVTGSWDTPLARSGFYDRMLRVQHGALVGEFITPEQLDERQIMQASRALQGTRYVTVQREGPRGRTTVAGRDGRCAMTVLLDGVRMNGVLRPGAGRADHVVNSNGMRADERDLTIDELVDGGSVAAIEIYPSTANAPAELVPLTGGGSCGIIALWTGGRRE